jgi:hypothetical protein
LLEPVATLGVGDLRRDLAAQWMHETRGRAFRILVETHENPSKLDFSHCEAGLTSLRILTQKPLIQKTKKLAHGQLFWGT